MTRFVILAIVHPFLLYRSTIVLALLPRLSGRRPGKQGGSTRGENFGWV